MADVVSEIMGQIPDHSAELRLERLPARLEAEELGDTTALRRWLVPELRAILDAGRAEAEAALLRDGDGMDCVRRLSGLMDRVIRALHDSVVRHLYPADNPSSSEKLAHTSSSP